MKTTRFLSIMAAMIPLVAVPAASAHGQDFDPRIQAAVSQAQEGDSDAARAVVQNIIASTPGNDPLYPQALYAAGIVAGSAQDAQRYFRRVALEYGWSPWADDALLRLAQLRYATHDPLGTVRAAEQLKADYPASEALPTAAYWAARASIDLNDTEAACGWVDVGLNSAGDNVEIANQLTYFRGRCSGGGGEGANQLPPPPPPSGPLYRVQVAAVSTQAAADELTADLRNAGFVVLVEHESGLYKIRAGEYRSRATADDAVRTIKSRFGGQPFVVSDE
jgi:hypothetical protein